MIRVVNSIRVTVLQRYLSLLGEVEAVDLSPGEVLQRLFLGSHNDSQEELSDILWPLDLEFLTDLRGKKTELRRAKAAMWHTRLVLSAHLRSNSDFSARTLTHFPISPERLLHIFGRPDNLRTEFGWDFYETEDIVGFLRNPSMPTQTVSNSSDVQEPFSFPNVMDMAIVRLQYNMSTFRVEPNDSQFSDLLN